MLVQPQRAFVVRSKIYLVAAAIRSQILSTLHPAVAMAATAMTRNSGTTEGHLFGGVRYPRPQFEAYFQ